MSHKNRKLSDWELTRLSYPELSLYAKDNGITATRRENIIAEIREKGLIKDDPLKEVKEAVGPICDKIF